MRRWQLREASFKVETRAYEYGSKPKRLRREQRPSFLLNVDKVGLTAEYAYAHTKCNILGVSRDAITQTGKRFQQEVGERYQSALTTEAVESDSAADLTEICV